MGGEESLPSTICKHIVSHRVEEIAKRGGPIFFTTLIIITAEVGEKGGSSGEWHPLLRVGHTIFMHCLFFECVGSCEQM